jgi:hypothetical protein
VTQFDHFSDISGAFRFARLLELIGKHEVFLVMVVIVRDPVFQPDLCFLDKIHNRNLLIERVSFSLACWPWDRKPRTSQAL